MSCTPCARTAPVRVWSEPQGPKVITSLLHLAAEGTCDCDALRQQMVQLSCAAPHGQNATCRTQAASSCSPNGLHQQQGMSHAGGCPGHYWGW